MIALFLIALMSLAIFQGLQTISKLALNVAVRDEGYRLLQAEAERLLAADYAGFTATTSDQSITSNIKTTFLPGNQAQFEYPASGSAGRVTFTRRVVGVSSTGAAKSLRVEVQWTWQGRPSLISTLLYRAQ
ncbi:MAG: hypothetical protein JSR48_07465 [Verrucomicrobia bacterium]|nr:hypothetical protein [Verrucomicrobiota bacterium]